MKTRWYMFLFLIVVSVGSPKAAESKQRPHSSEQLHFSAEDTGVQKPIAIPEDARAILRKDETVQGALEDKNLSGEKLPPSWFSASAIHLSTLNRVDVVVVGQPPIVGGSVTTFWVFCATAHGYDLVLTAPAHDLIVKNTHWKGHRDIELTSMTAAQISMILYRFDGVRYARYKAKSEPIH